MIELENLNNQSIDEILEEAKRRITYLTDEWTNFQEPDPGITLVELFSWLKWVQHEYLNRIQPEVKRKFLKLLDVEIQRDKGAETLLYVSDINGDVNLPIGTQFNAGKMTFENPEKQFLIKSNILSVSFNNPEFKKEEEYYKFDGSKIFYLFGEHFYKSLKPVVREFTINFDTPLPTDKIMNIYFSVFSDNKSKRNPIKADDYFEEMAEVSWEYFGEENKVLGWHKLDIVKDFTHNFIFSGIIKMRLHGVSKENNGVYSIRARLISNDYDFPPKINDLKCNVFPVEQKLTKCKSIKVLKKDIQSDGSIVLEENISLYGKSDVYIKKHGGWVQTYNFKFERDFNQGKFFLMINDINTIIERLYNDEEAVLVVSYTDDFQNRIILGDGLGMSYQNFEFRDKLIKYDDLKLLVGEEHEERTENGIVTENVFDTWSRVDDFFSSSKTDKHFIFDEAAERISFGDHVYGMAPRKAKNNIKFANVVYCYGADSNIKQGMINSVVTKNENMQTVRIVQINRASGGVGQETVEQAQARATNLFNDKGRAITKEDYYDIVKTTPGLIFNNIKILPNYMPGVNCDQQNCVTIAVRWNNKVGLTLPNSYKNNILHQIDKHRLVNTKINVVGPEYIGLIVSGQIMVASFYKTKDQIIEKQVRKFVSLLNMDMGRTLKFGDLFADIDNLEYVAHLLKLNVNPIGNYIKKTTAEDIIIPPNGIYYVKEIDFEYIKSSEIYTS